VRKLEIILFPLTENNPNLNIKSAVSKGTTIECIVSERSRVIGISALNVKACYRLDYKKDDISDYVFGQLMSMLYNLTFLLYHYHKLENHA
jgi:hypothetical protein